MLRKHHVNACHSSGESPVGTTSTDRSTATIAVQDCFATLKLIFIQNNDLISSQVTSSYRRVTLSFAFQNFVKFSPFSVDRVSLNRFKHSCNVFFQQMFNFCIKTSERRKAKRYPFSLIFCCFGSTTLVRFKAKQALPFLSN